MPVELLPDNRVRFVPDRRAKPDPAIAERAETAAMEAIVRQLDDNVDRRAARREVMRVMRGLKARKRDRKH
jgi:hypothetical protein